MTFHDLRGTAVTRLALVGCTEAEIAAITGHSLRDVRSILDANYLHRDPALAESAITKLEMGYVRSERRRARMMVLVGLERLVSCNLICRAHKLAIGFLYLAILLVASTIEGGAADDWQQDFRRCLVRKQFSDGSVVISAGDERMLEIDVQWSDGATLDNLGDVNMSVQIDHFLLPRLQPLKSDVGMIYGYRLGSFDSVLPALSRGKHLIVSIASRPERSVELDIGAGKEAVAFLRKCDMYWTNLHIATNAWEKGRASAQVGEYARAIRDFDQAIQKLPKDYTTVRARILFERGQAKLRKGDKTGGNADIRAATKLRRWIATMDDIGP